MNESQFSEKSFLDCIKDYLRAKNHSEKEIKVIDNLKWRVIVDEGKYMSNPYVVRKYLEGARLPFDISLYPQEYLKILEKHGCNKKWIHNPNPNYIMSNEKISRDLKRAGINLETMKSVVEEQSPNIKFVQLPEYEKLWFFIATNMKISQDLAFSLVKTIFPFRFIFPKILHNFMFETDLRRQKTELSNFRFNIFNDIFHDIDLETIIEKIIQYFYKTSECTDPEININDFVGSFLYVVDFKQVADIFCLKELLDALSIPFDLAKLPQEYVEIMKKFHMIRSREISIPEFLKEGENKVKFLESYFKNGYSIDSERKLVELASQNIKVVYHFEFDDDRMYLISKKEMSHQKALVYARVIYDLSRFVKWKLLFINKSEFEFYNL